MEHEPQTVLSDVARRIVLRLDNGGVIGSASRLLGNDSKDAVLLNAAEAEKAGKLLQKDLDRLNTLLAQAAEYTAKLAPVSVPTPHTKVCNIVEGDIFWTYIVQRQFCNNSTLTISRKRWQKADPPLVQLAQLHRAQHTSAPASARFMSFNICTTRLVCL